MKGEAEKITPKVKPRDLEPSPSLSLLAKAVPTLEGRKVGVLVGKGSDSELLEKLQSSLKREGAKMELVAPKIAGIESASGEVLGIAHTISGGPSVMFDALVVALSAEAAEKLKRDGGALNWVRDAFAHLKVIGYTEGAASLIERAQIEPDPGIIQLSDAKSIPSFVKAAKGGRIWERERKLHGE